MQLNTIPLRKALNPAYRKQKVSREEMEHFKSQLITLLERINAEESEENAKFHLAAFLNQVYYQGKYLIATKDRADMVIHLDKSAKSNPGVLLETKRPQADGKTAPDMVSLERPNVKALHELLLYFLRERIEHKNTDLKFLVVTDIHQWFVFSATDFERFFYQNKKLVKDYKDWRDGRKSGKTTDFFYKDIAQPYLESLTEAMDCTFFDIRDYLKFATNEDPKDDKKLIPLYKILSPAHLLRLPFANDSNSLNKDFYYELLHIIGLEENKLKNKKVIQRKTAGERDDGSLLENAIRTLETEDRLRRVPNLQAYGRTKEDQLFGVGLELCITWVNRILFLKLLEAQLLKYHQGDRAYRFLNADLLTDYDELNELFFDALAKQKDQRPSYAQTKFARIPYLNSSLFEISEMEDVTIRVNSMKDRFELPLYSRTVLKDEKGKRQNGQLKTLEYLFAFLDAYDFSSEGSESIQEENKTLINASVLGLIFEKINGYQDGAFFTPGFITMYMCRETLRRATVQKFKTSAYFEDFDSDEFSDLQNYLARKYSTDDLVAANALINGLKICDPAVGSGHFLVSALNELLCIKSELGILTDRKHKPLTVRLEVANDELTIQWQRSDDFFEYYPGVQESQLVQEAIFHEKQHIIENCLFGVDLNPNSVKICRLRLWIELLKNTYYQNGNVQEDLETLPNIDINIKQGNSLVSRFALDEDLKPVLKKSKWNIHDYRIAISSYQHAQNKEDKRQLLEQINAIKSDFQTHIYNNDPKIKRLAKLNGQKFVLENQVQVGNLFEKLKETDITDDLEKLKRSIEKIETEIEAARNAAIYQDAFEWRFEFPEVLDEAGNFVGFDVVVGNPPYIRQEEFKELKPYLKDSFSTFAGTADLLVYFIERSHQIMRPHGQFSFIISNKFMRAGFGRNLRTWLQNLNLQTIIDFGDLPVFEEATTYPCVLSWEKAPPKMAFVAANVPELRVEDFQDYLKTISFSSLQTALRTEGWTLADVKTQQLLEKLQQSGKPLGEYVDGKIYYGIKTGLNEAFVIDAATKDQLIAEDPNSAEIIKPFLAGRDVKRYVQPVADKFLILFKKGWTKDTFGDLEESKAFEQLNHQYPSIAKHFLPFTEKGRKRYDQGDYWWELRACDYYEEFEQNKIMLPDIAIKAQCIFDESGAYCVNTAYIIPTRKKWLLGLLNSSLTHFFYSNSTSTIRGGYLRFIRQYLEKIPVVDIPNITSQILGKVDRILIQEDSNTNTLEAQIDLLVYQLYGLTYEEVLLVDPEFEMKKEVYAALVENRMANG